jgi:hypothetical protein
MKMVRNVLLLTIAFLVILSSVVNAAADPAFLMATIENNDWDIDGDGEISEDEVYYTFDEPYSGVLECNHPEIKIFKGGKDVTGKEFVQGSNYVIQVKVYNEGDELAQDVNVALGYADLGVGQEYLEISSQTVEIEAGESKELEFSWHPGVSGHQCLQVTISCDDDSDEGNNYAQRNLDITESTPGAVLHKKMIVRNKLRVKPTQSGGLVISDANAFAMRSFVRFVGSYDSAINRQRVKVSIKPRMFVLKGKQGQIVDVKITLDEQIPEGETVKVNIKAIAPGSGRIVDGVIWSFPIIAGSSSNDEESGDGVEVSDEEVEEAVEDSVDDLGLDEEGEIEDDEEASDDAAEIPERMKKENVEARIEEFAENHELLSTSEDENGRLRLINKDGEFVRTPLPVYSGLSPEEIENLINEFGLEHNLNTVGDSNGKPVYYLNSEGEKFGIPIRRILGLPRPSVADEEADDNAGTSIYLNDGEWWQVVNDNVRVIGGSSYEAIKILAGVEGVVVDSTIERVDFAGNIADFQFRQGFGSNIDVLDASDNVIASVSSVDGKKFGFDDGVVELEYTDETVSVGGTDITDTAASVVPEVIDEDDNYWDDIDDYYEDNNTTEE